MADKLSGAVGPARANNPVDVKVVQHLLNRCLGYLIPLAPLAETGVYGPATSSAIALFQQRIMGLSATDVTLSPDSSTWKKLEALARTPVPERVRTFIQDCLPAARQVKAKWKVPISVLIAQAALESGWGQSVNGNAYFGIKGRSGSAGAVQQATHEYVGGARVAVSDSFRAYKDFADAADGYGEFLATNPRYADCFRYTDDPLKFLHALVVAGYATDPSYEVKVAGIIERYVLTQYDH
jgi:flagellum-specific peptidoglycan hydrolase FlgJ